MSDATPSIDRQVAAWRVVRVLAWREIIRFVRQRNRVIGALGQPILFWLLFGAGLHDAFQMGGSDSLTFSEYFFPGTMMLIIMFTAIFATISIIEDRKEGFLQGVLVAPIPRWSMVMGKVLGGSILAMAQAVIFLSLSFTMGVSFEPLRWLQLLLLIFASALALTSLGFVLAWRMESTQGFHAIMNLLLMPMWLLSGAFFPAPPATSEAWGQLAMHWAMRLNPLSYAVAGVRRLLSPNLDYSEIWAPSMAASWSVTLGFALVSFAVAWKIAEQRTRGDLL